MDTTINRKVPPYAAAVEGFVTAVNERKLFMQSQAKLADSDHIITLSDVFRNGEDLTGVNPISLRSIYYGHAVPSLIKSLRIAKWLGSPVEALFSTEGVSKE